MNRCRRCNREISDPNAVFGWRCAEILGVSETLSGMGQDTFNKFLDGVTKAHRLFGNGNLTDEQYKRIYSAFAKQSIWKGVDEKKVKEAKKESYPLISKDKSKISSLNDDLKEYKSYLDTASNVLTTASLVPGLDTITNLVSIPVDLARGDYVSAGLSAFGILPVVGEVADTAKIVRTADKIADTAKVVDKATDAVKVTNKSKNIINKQKKGTPRNNRTQNKQTDAISKKLKLSPKQQRELHDIIHGQNYGYQEILDYAKSWFNK